MTEIARVTFACQHTTEYGADVEVGDVRCPRCGERRVQRVEVPPPRFRAVGCDEAPMGPRVIHG